MVILKKCDICKDMPIVATSNLKSKICSNRMEFKIEENIL